MFFGVVIDNQIWRAAYLRPHLMLRLPLDMNSVSSRNLAVILLEFGDVIHIEQDIMIYQLSPEYQRISAQSIVCQLHCDEPPESTSLRSQLLVSNFTIRDFKIVDNINNTLYLIFQNPTVYRQSILRLGELTCEESNDIDCNEMMFDEEDTTGNPMKLLTGYDTQGHKRVCPFSDKNISGCFK